MPIANAVQRGTYVYAYRWHPARRVWWIEGDNERVGHESAFLRSLYPLIRLVVEEVDWFTRHRD